MCFVPDQYTLTHKLEFFSRRGLRSHNKFSVLCSTILVLNFNHRQNIHFNRIVFLNFKLCLQEIPNFTIVSQVFRTEEFIPILCK